MKSKLNTALLWEVSSGSESIKLLVRQAENSTSGRGSFWERSPLGSWFSTSVFRNVPGTVPESVRIYGFQRNSYNLGTAPKMRGSLLLNSWDRFLMTLPSISSKTYVKNSSLILGTDVFRDWLFLGYPCVSFEKAANFRLFLNTVMSWKVKAQQ